jgi:hypothetical protein
VRDGPADDIPNPLEVPMSRGFVPPRRPWVALAALALAVASPSSVPAQTEYDSQDSATTKLHSGIVTSKGVVWDTDFAAMVTKAIGPANYSEAAFAFMECFGGGMIDELAAAKLNQPAAYTSAARHDQVSWAFPTVPALVTPQNLVTAQSTYNMPWAPVAGGAVNFTMQQAAVVGRNNDPAGPVLKTWPSLYPRGYQPFPGAKVYPVQENPQYTSSGASGNSITLHQPNPNNAVNNPKYLAVLFGGSTNEVANANSLKTVQDALVARGYDAKTEEKIIQPGGSAKDLKAAWDWVAQNTSPSTQVFYWNDWGHGTRGKDVKGTIQQLLGANFVPTSGATYTFGVESDLVSDVVAHAGYARSIGDADPLDSPYFEIQTGRPISNLTVTLNGHSLTSLGVLDLFGDGSEFDYDFALGPGDLQLLGDSNTISLSWAGAADPSFGLWMLNDGDLGNFSDSAFVPEPGSWIMFLLGVGPVGVAWLDRRRGRIERAGVAQPADPLAVATR